MESDKITLLSDMESDKITLNKNKNMAEVKIRLSGTGIILNSIEDEDNSGEMQEFAIILSGVNVTANGEDITKKKGKYIKSKSYIKDNLLVSDDFPVWFMMIEDEFDFGFNFIIEDCDYFDPKKLQLIKSDYELEVAPYGIICDKIIYDGEEISVEYDDDYDEAFDYYMSGYVVLKVDKMPYC